MKIGKTAVASNAPNRPLKQKAPKSLGSVKARNGRVLFLCALPVIFYILLFGYGPLWGLGYAFVDYKLGKPLTELDFVGLKNFRMLFSNKVIRENIFQSLFNTLGMQMIDWILIGLPMLFAILLSELRSTAFKKVVQTVSTLPNFISTVVVMAIVSALMDSSGLIPNLLVDLGIWDKPVNIFMDEKNVWIELEVIQRWKGLGWSSIIYFSAIAGIDQDQYEAAAIDGAGRWARIRYITIPHLMPTMVVQLIMSIGRCLNTGTEFYLLFENAFNKKYITTLDLYVYHLGIGNGMIPSSVAIGILKTVVALTLFYIANFVSKKVRGTGIA